MNYWRGKEEKGGCYDTAHHWWMYPVNSESSIALDDLEQQLRACLLRINACQSFLSANPPECTFSLVVETNLSPPIFDNQSSSSSSSTFVPSDVSEQVHHHKWNNLIPIKTISMDAFRINTFVLEAIKKGKHAVKWFKKSQWCLWTTKAKETLQGIKNTACWLLHGCSCWHWRSYHVSSYVARFLITLPRTIAIIVI